MNKINSLRKFFKSFAIDGYLIPKNDEYFNEYVTESKDRLKFISNFSGSAGFAVILKNKNYLFVDGRYSIQGRIQSGKKFNIITIPEKFPRDVLKEKKIIIGFDPKLHNEKQLYFLFNIKNIILKPISKNLIDMIWLKKPKDFIKPFFILSKKDSGKSFHEKISKVKNFLIKEKIDYLFVTAPENVAWILNIRGYDSLYSPIPNARLLIRNNGNIYLFSESKKVTKIKNKFFNKIKFFNESDIDKTLKILRGKNILIDSLSCSIYYKNLLYKGNKIKL